MLLRASVTLVAGRTTGSPDQAEVRRHRPYWPVEVTTMTKFPMAEAVIRAEMAKDAQFALDFAAFVEGLASEEPEVPADMTDDRACEIVRTVRAA